jgi:hypothetical protein
MLSGKRMNKRIIITALVLAAIHFVLVVGAVVISFGSGMEAFDNPDYQLSVIERVAILLAGILMQPGMSLWTSWMSKNMPDFIEWGFFLFNSLLWGSTLALVLNAPKLLKGKKPDNSGVHSISESRANESSRNE